MTRKTRREIERDVADLTPAGEADPGPLLVHEDPESDEWYDPHDGRVFDKDEIDPVAVIVDPDDPPAGWGAADGA